MPYNEFGQFVPDETLSVDDMRHQLLAKNQTPKFIQNLEALYQLLPQNLVTRNVKPLTEATATVGSGLAAPFLGVAKGIGENIINRTNKKVDRPELAEPFTYQPRTEGGQQLVEQIMSGLEASKLPPYIAGGMGRFRFTPDDLRVAGKTAVSDVRNFPMDYANARAGLQREYPTLGSTAAGGMRTAETANQALNKAILFPSDVAVQKITGNPLATSTGVVQELGQFNPLSMAMKPKGGNWPISLGSKLPLAEQGRIGEYLGTSTVGPVKLWREQLREIGEENNWYDFLRRNNAEDISLKDPRYADLANLFTTLINNRSNTMRQQFPDADLLPTIKPLDELSKLTDAYNKWITEGPHKKYVTTQYGTGIETDPVLNAIDTANVDPFTRLLDRDATSDRKSMKRDVERLRERYDDALKYHERFPNSSDTFPDPAKTLFYPDINQFVDVGDLTARTPAGQKFENAQDYVLGDYSAFYHPQYADEEIKTNFPVSTKLKIGTPVYDVISADILDKTGLKEIKQHVLDKVLSGEISPEKLPSVSVESIVRDMIKTRVDAIKKAQKSKELYLDWRQKNHEQLPADVAFTDVEGNPTGSKMVVFDADMAEANPDLVIRNLSQDTKELNHCVGSCGHGTAEYPNRHVPMVEPHTGTTPKGSDATYGPNYIKKIKNGDIQIASLRGPNGESKATLELKPDPKHISMDVLDTMITDWLDNFNSEYLTKYNKSKSDRDIVTAVSDAQRDNPKLEEYIDDFMKKSSTSFRVDQIKGEGNRELKPDAVEAVKNWLNSKGDLVKLNRISDLDNLPGIIDLRNTKPHEIADIYQSINPDKLDSFLNDLVDKKLEGNELTKHRFEMGDIHPSEIIRDEIPRFVNIDDLRKAAEKHGYDIERRSEDVNPPKNQNLTELQKVVIESAVQDFHHGIDIGDLNDEYRANIEAILGLSGYQYRLPEHVHMELARKLLGGDEYRTWIQTTWNNARAASLEGLSLAQMDNVAHIIQNWLHLHPFAD